MVTERDKYNLAVLMIRVHGTNGAVVEIGRLIGKCQDERKPAYESVWIDVMDMALDFLAEGAWPWQSAH